MDSEGESEGARSKRREYLICTASKSDCSLLTYLKNRCNRCLFDCLIRWAFQSRFKVMLTGCASCVMLGCVLIPFCISNVGIGSVFDHVSESVNALQRAAA